MWLLAAIGAPSIVKAIPGEESQVTIALLTEQLDASAAFMAHIHVEQLQQAHPLRHNSA
jgi:hypothetical protein